MSLHDEHKNTNSQTRDLAKTLTQKDLLKTKTSLHFACARRKRTNIIPERILQKNNKNSVRNTITKWCKCGLLSILYYR